MHWVYYAGRVLCRIILFSLSSCRVKGRENIPDQGPYLIVCNHLHVVDPPILTITLGLKTALMAKDELFRNWFHRYFVKNFGAFPVRRGVADRNALRQAEQRLSQGFSLIMFPEGKRTDTIQMQPALTGSALLSSHIGVPILPVSITGTERLRESAWWLRRPRITVNIGQPFYLPQTNSKLTKVRLVQLTDSMMRRIAELLPPEYQGVYAKEENTKDRESQ